MILRGLDACLVLDRHRWVMPLTHRRNLRGPWLHVDATASAVVAHATTRLSSIPDIVVDHRPLIDRADPTTHPGHSAVVVEAVATPVAAEVADADIAEAVINSAVVADVPSPVAGVKAVVAPIPTPIRRRPKRAIVGRFNPRAGNPVVATAPPGPVARGPHIARTGRGRLVVFRQFGRRLRRLFESLFAGLLIRGGLVAGLLRVRLLRISLLNRRWRLLRIALLLRVRLALLLRRVGGILPKDLGLAVGLADRREVGLRRVWPAGCHAVTAATGRERECAR